MEKIEYVYESPDKGRTVYRRPIGTQDRELIEQCCVNCHWGTFNQYQDACKTCTPQFGNWRKMYDRFKKSGKAAGRKVVGNKVRRATKGGYVPDV